MSGEVLNPQSFAELTLSAAYPAWTKPEPADNPTKHRKTHTFVRAFANAWDNVVAAAKSAAYCHAASTCPADGLDDLGATYGGLARALIDDEASYRAYLKAPLDRWYTFGTRGGLLGELAHLGYPNAQVVSWRDLVDAGAGAENVVFGGNTTFFYVAIFKPNPFDNLGRARWLTSGARWTTSQAVWGGIQGDATRLDELRRTIALVKPAHTSCRHIVLFKDTASGLNAQLLPTGNFTVAPMNEPWERIRPSYAYNSYYIYSPLVP